MAGSEQGVRLKAYKRIESILESLTSRTNLKVSLKNETWELKGLNSPYLSHQTVALTDGHGIDRLVVFGENELFVFTVDCVVIVDDMLVRDLPAFHFDRLFKFPVSRPNWFRGNVKVAFPDRFNGYDRDGSPVFNKNVYVAAKDRRGAVVEFIAPNMSLEYEPYDEE